jgi:hypothetical protein
MTLPAMLAAYQQGKSDLFNTLLDKLYQDLDAPTVSGVSIVSAVLPPWR